jgi:pimeloyl-ACP methyl ester carboxylesterase
MPALGQSATTGFATKKMRRDQHGTRVVDRVINTADGRALLVQEGGDPAGRAVLVHLGTPDSRILYWPHLLDASERGIRLISYDRPGYGGSAAQPGRSIADCATDVHAIIDALDIERFAVWGISGGGPHALACAALLPDRVVAAATLASTAPFDTQDLDWFAGVGQENVEGGELMLNDHGAARAKFAQDRHDLLNATATELLALKPTLYTRTDAAALTEELAEYYIRRDKDALAPGIEGWWDDSVALLKPWEFSPETIHVPVMVWQGRQDRMVPFQHGEWLVNHLPNVDAHLTEEDGHLTLLRYRVPTVHSWLLEHF